jgi:beta-glucosidase-like glycosyl hydrolase
MLNLEKKLYQLIISRLEGDRISSGAYHEHIIELVKKGIGGFIVFGGEMDEVKSFIHKIQTMSEKPLFIASDIERGAGQQLKGATGFPSQMAVAAAFSKDRTEDSHARENMVRAIADESMDVGINMPLIPVMDVNQNPDNPIISVRAFSDDPDVVACFGSTYIKTIESAGLISCAKHFPGHGDTNIDSHISLPVISRTLNDLISNDVYPFRKAIESGVSSIMIGHLSIPAIDAVPASLSGKVINDLLRSDLGFEGIVLTDALNMHALSKFENVPARCINAGVDILLHPADPDAVVEELKQGVASGEVEIAAIDTALERIDKYKSKIRSAEKPEIDEQKHRELSRSITDKSITLVKGAEGADFLKGIEKSSLIYVGDENDFDIMLLKEFISDSKHIRETDCRNSAGEIIVIAIFTSIAAWKGSSGIGNEDVIRIKGCMKSAKHSIVISFGSPYVLGHFKEADMLVAAYDTSRQAQDSVISCLKSDIGFEGSLPVQLVFS